MFRAKGLCEDSKEVFFPPSSRMEKQDQIRYYVGKGSHSKSTWIQHNKANKILKRNAPQLQCLDHSFDHKCMILGSYMLWIIILITLTLSLVFCIRVFDPRERKPNISKRKQRIEDLRANPFEEGEDDDIPPSMD